MGETKHTLRFTSLIKARAALKTIWDTAMLKGRCWGPISDNNPYSASNITIANYDELVTISIGLGGLLIVHEFKLSPKRTNLGNDIKEVLEKSGISFIERWEYDNLNSQPDSY